MAVPAESIVLHVISWLFFLKLLQTALWPLLEKVLGRYGYPASYSASVLLFTALSWYLALAGLPVPLAAVPFLALLAVQAGKGCYQKEKWQGMWRWDLIFLVAFLVILEFRYMNPSISSGEKFMDHAFLASLMRTPVVPPPDPWYAGGSLNIYYYLGYWMAGAVGLTTAVPSSVVFNLAIPTVVGMAAVNLWMVGDLLLPRLSWLPVLVLLLVNPSFVVHTGIQVGNSAAWGNVSLMDLLWTSTRTIENTITEFPLASFVGGDPHSHVLAMGNQAFLIFLLGFLFTRWQTLGGRGRAGLSLLVALSLGTMPPSNSWDALVYAPFTLVVVAACAWQAWKAGQREAARHALSALVLVPVGAVALYLPYYFQMVGGAIQGVNPVPAPSDPVQFLLVHGFLLAVILLVGIRGARTRPLWVLPAVGAGVLLGLSGYPAAGITASVFLLLFTRNDRDYPWWLAAAGLCVLIVPELLYLKDHFGAQYFRLNTVFKFSSIAWIMLGTAAMIFVGRFLHGLHLPDRVPGTLSRAVAVIAVAVLLTAPLVLPLNVGYRGGTLDGLAFLNTAQPGDAAAIRYLSTLNGDEVIVEAVKGDYEYYSRISAFTGIPAVIGSPFHEFTWRGGDAGVMARVADVKVMYEDPSRRSDLAQKYHATLLYVGDPERVLYPSMDLSGGGLTPLYDAGGVTIYRFTG